MALRGTSQTNGGYLCHEKNEKELNKQKLWISTAWLGSHNKGFENHMDRAIFN